MPATLAWSQQVRPAWLAWLQGAAAAGGGRTVCMQCRAPPACAGAPACERRVGAAGGWRLALPASCASCTHLTLRPAPAPPLPAPTGGQSAAGASGPAWHQGVGQDRGSDPHQGLQAGKPAPPREAAIASQLLGAGRQPPLDAVCASPRPPAAHPPNRLLTPALTPIPYALQCRRRWKNFLNMAAKTCSWSAEVGAARGGCGCPLMLLGTHPTHTHSGGWDMQPA